MRNGDNFRVIAEWQKVWFRYESNVVANAAAAKLSCSTSNTQKYSPHPAL